MVFLSMNQRLAIRECLTKIIKLSREEDLERAQWAFRALESLDRGQFGRLGSVFCKLKREKIEARNKLLASGDLNEKTRIIWDNEIARLREWQYRVRGGNQKKRKRRS